MSTVKVIPQSHSETQMDELLRHPHTRDSFSKPDVIECLMKSKGGHQAKQSMLYSMQCVRWYLNN
ncbi:hypothetical protein VPHK479_0099 [Vibrio phage K479]